MSKKRVHKAVLKHLGQHIRFDAVRETMRRLHVLENSGYPIDTQTVFTKTAGADDIHLVRATIEYGFVEHLARLGEDDNSRILGHLLVSLDKESHFFACNGLVEEIRDNMDRDNVLVEQIGLFIKELRPLSAGKQLSFLRRTRRVIWSVINFPSFFIIQEYWDLDIDQQTFFNMDTILLELVKDEKRVG